MGEGCVLLQMPKEEKLRFEFELQIWSRVMVTGGGLVSARVAGKKTESQQNKLINNKAN
jgi:hypothetical protein